MDRLEQLEALLIVVKETLDARCTCHGELGQGPDELDRLEAEVGKVDPEWRSAYALDQAEIRSYQQ